MKEICITPKNSKRSEVDLLFGPLTGRELFFILDDFSCMADVWVKIGLFKSKSQARKNGHGGDIPSGFSDIIKKKRNLRVTIWNPEGVNDG